MRNRSSLSLDESVLSTCRSLVLGAQCGAFPIADAMSFSNLVWRAVLVNSHAPTSAATANSAICTNEHLQLGLPWPAWMCKALADKQEHSSTF